MTLKKDLPLDPSSDNATKLPEQRPNGQLRPAADETVSFGDLPTRTAGTAGLRPAPTRLPKAIGRYRILGKLGEGGMAVVYEAEQQHPKRKVALKVIRGGQFVDESSARMLQREAETLALLKHPNIGAIYESGRTEDGQHFFAMELVRGETLGVYLGQRPKSITREELELRLRLFRKIADAVHYAHQRGVIHRDLKPSNLIVTEPTAGRDDSSSLPGVRIPEIKILDFGLARITERDIGATQTTEVGVIKGTLPYMSPEQARGDPKAIDVRTDVYALGVILYKMLTHHLPYDVGRMSLVEAVWVICEERPRPLQQSWSGVHRLDPDIDTIVGKALEKQVEQRYASAAALSEDVTRYLTSRPILARPPSAVYELKKFVRRNRVGVAGAAAVAAAIVIGMVVATIGFVQASRERDRAVAAEGVAKQEAEKASAISGFLTNMLSSANPERAQGDKVTVRQVLDRTSEDVGESFADQPEVEAAVRLTLGKAYDSLGFYDDAEPHLERANQVRRETLGVDHLETLDAVNALAVVYFHQGRYDDAETLWVERLESLRGTLGHDDPRTLTGMQNLGAVYLQQRRYDEAELLIAQALEGRRRVLGPEHAETIASMSNLGYLYDRLGRYDEAGPLLTEALELRKGTLGERHPRTLISMVNLGNHYKYKDRFEEAAAIYAEAAEKMRLVMGEDHPNTLRAVCGQASSLVQAGKFSGAESVALECYQRNEARSGAAGPRTVRAAGILVQLYEATSQPQKAAEWRSRLED